MNNMKNKFHLEKTMKMCYYVEKMQGNKNENKSCSKRIL